MNSSYTTFDASPLRNRSYSPIITPQKNIVQVNTYVKPVEVYPQHTYIQATPPRSTNINMNTASTVPQTYYSINGSAPARFNQALDQVCLLGNEMDIVRKNFELVSVELQQWKDKCALIKAIASTPPPGTSYSPQRVTQLRNDVQNQFSQYQYEITKLNNIIGSVNNELQMSTEKIKALERKIGEMNKIELDMLNAKKQALELDNRNRFQELELNDLKFKIDTKNNQNDELIKQILIVPQLKQSMEILEEENRKIISILQQKEDQLKRSDQIHIQITKMYQENLEKSNLLVNQIKELQNENSNFHKEIEKLNQIAESVSNNKNPQEEQRKRGRNMSEMSFNEEDLKKLKAGSSQNQVQSQRNNNKLSQIQTILIDQQAHVEQLQQQNKDKDQILDILAKEKESLVQQINGQQNNIQQLKNNNLQQQEEHEQKLKKSKMDFNDQVQNATIPLQKENEQMHLEIERLQHELKQSQYIYQELKVENNKLENQMNVERQQAQNSQQKIIKDNELKCNTLTERVVQKENQLNEELLKNKDLFDDNKLMAEEMRVLKQKSNELDYWKNKYRELKKETKALRIQFDEYRQNFIREIQNRFSNGCDQFESYLQLIDERFDSTRNITQFNVSNSDYENKYQQYFQSPSKPISEFDPKIKTRTPSKDRSKLVMNTNLKSSAVKQQSQQHNKYGNSSIITNPISSNNTSQIIYERSDQNQQQSNNISISSINKAKNTTNSNNQDKQQIMNQQANKYQNEIKQTNEELDHKLEELVILKAKYEEALNRVHSNVNTPSKN